MDFMTTFFIYLLVWWVTIFTVLPLGVERNSETGKGHDAGAPVRPDLKKKLILNSILSAVIVLVIWLLVYFHVIEWEKWFRYAIK
jgi:predicted secreted protein